jgi:DNA-binding response OmpR family regulator
VVGGERVCIVEGLQLAVTEGPEIVLPELGLPELAGGELLRTLRTVNPVPRHRGHRAGS